MNNVSDSLAIAFQHQQAGRFFQAEQIYTQILQEQPNQVDALYLLGTLAHQSGKTEKAIALYRQALAVNPDLASVHSNLGIALKQQGLLQEAIQHYQEAIALQPNAAQFHYNLALVFQQQGNLATAQNYYRQATIIQPNYALAYNNLGLVSLQLGEIEAALSYYQTAIELQPNFAEAHQNLAEALLLIGDFDRGFAEYEWRWRVFAPEQLPNFTTPAWDGSALKGKTILLYAEQGLGDTFQFIRYADLVRDQGGRVIVACLAAQVELIKTVPGVEEVFALDEELPEFHTQAPLMSLPYLLGTTVETIPASIPYISAPSSHNFRLAAAPDTKLKIGIVWAGNPDNRHNIRRTSGLLPFIPLFKLPDVEFYSLQVGKSSQDLAQLPTDIKIQDLSSYLHNFSDTAAAIAQLDIVLTIDTSVAHLAGALGKPTWVVLPFIPDWRWLLHRDNSPWYPTMQLFRQEVAGDWAGVFAKVAQEILKYEV
ncbi:tetratricopeptide repeat protein [Nostoc sp. FACHB-110]|uniref:tetratricopeptide repeat protein n=1 Tax=Nostoc sp. FACHB-110 TaxID=2692834 RepID=UPI00168535B2|nr:tetratricopeptide repeat protein [Nostoc sp. FACHB-110]MBD2437888.1 tetratricopeptide repeat protein [Nostoc sp. FACHB-110]